MPWCKRGSSVLAIIIRYGNTEIGTAHVEGIRVTEEQKKEKKDKKQRKNNGSFLPAFCNALGTVMLMAVIVLCLPLTAPRFMGYEIYEVVSGSMEPAIPMGSVLYVEQVDPADLVVDDVVAFHRDDSVVAHRVVANRTSLGELVTKGDANNAEDPDPVPYENVVGIVARHVPILGQFMGLYTSNIGKVYLLLTAACGVMLNILAGRIREDRRNRIKEQLLADKLAGNEPGESEEEPGEHDDDDSAKPKRSRGAKIRLFLICVLSIVFMGSAGVVAFVSHERAESDRVYHDASDRFTEKSESSSSEDSEKVMAPIKINFKKLRKENEDIVGWIYCEDTPINYPVLKGETNDTYLRHDYTREYNISGSIFVDADNAPGFKDASTIIYGHHMNHGAMFATLDQWAEQEYYEEHPYMWLLTPEQDYQIVLVSGHHTSAYSDMYDIYHEHDDYFMRFLKEAEDQSDFTPVEKATINPKANYVMLTTCAYIFDNARYVIHGKLVPVDSAGGKPLSK